MEILHRVKQSVFFHEWLKLDTKGSHHTLEMKREFRGLNKLLEVLEGYQAERGLNGFQERAEFQLLERSVGMPTVSTKQIAGNRLPIPLKGA